MGRSMPVPIRGRRRGSFAELIPHHSIIFPIHNHNHNTPTTPPTNNVSCSDASNLPEHSVRVVEIKRIDDTKDLKSRTFAPLTFVLFVGFFLSCVLFGLSIWREDGMSLVATILLSLLSSLIGAGNKWTLQLPKRWGFFASEDIVVLGIEAR